MSHLIWTPGMAGPVEELVTRIERMATAFAAQHRLEQVQVRIELADGSSYVLATATAEPGYGFVSFTPHEEDGRRPRCVIVPVGAVKTVEITAPDPESPFGFAVSA